MKTKIDGFFQMPFREFVDKFPESVEFLKDLPYYENLLEDPRYIIRVTNGKFEIGYPCDDWQIH